MGALILGTTPQGSALKRALKTCTGFSVQVADGEPKWVTHDGDLTARQRTSWRPSVEQYDIVVALPSILRRVSETVSLVHRLRTDLYWDGCFVAVMRSVEQAERLRKASFVGEPIDDTRFDQIPGHVVLISPLRISELFSTTNDFDSRVVSPDYWHFDLLRSGRAARLNRQIKKAERSLGDHQTDKDIERVCRQILASLDAIDWSLVARRGKGHALSNSVRSLLGEHVAKEHLTAEACSTVVKEARYILAQSTFPFPQEE